MHSTSSSDPHHLVPLDADHPGFRDPVYRQRRDRIAQLALAHRSPATPPQVEYTEDEQEVWQTVWQNLQPLHRQLVCPEVRAILERLRFDETPIPQLAELDRLLRMTTGFSMQPVAGLVHARDFLTALADRVFLSTQYIRHPSAPLYTPEPDLIHEYVGHATTLLDGRFADLHAAFGEAARRSDEAGLQRLERVYWFTVEYGAVAGSEGVEAVGAGLLSSVQELAQLRRGPRLEAWDLEAMATCSYDPTQLQPRLFVAPDFQTMIAELGRWLQKQ